MTSDRIELASVRDELNQWRDGRSTPGRIPGPLKQKIGVLMKHHCLEELIEILPLKSSTLKRWQHRSGSGEKSAKFIALPSPARAVFSGTASKRKQGKSKAPIDNCIAYQGVSLSVELIDGIKLQVNGQRPAELVEFACAFARGLGR